jgi:photosystem II stability/assembly factor-like uncharacterized protein
VAHGGIPRAFSVVFEPGNPENILLRSDVWGIMHSADGGKSWQWSCAEVYGGQSLSTQRLAMRLSKGGRALVAGAFSGLQITDDFCGWHRAAGLGGELVQDITGSGNDLFVLTSTGSDVGIKGQLWRSTDNGEAWAPEGTLLPKDFAGSTAAFAPSQPQRVYVSGRQLGTGAAVVERSDDAGTTWSQVEIPGPKADAVLRLPLVHATRPDVAFLWVDLPEGLGQDAADEIWATKDAGRTWKLFYTGKGDLPGLAVSPDGATIVIAGPKEGVQSASVDDALANGPAAFKLVLELDQGKPAFFSGVWGLTWTDQGLYGGTDNFTAKGIPAFTLGVSQDGGHTFKQVMSLCQVAFGACASTSTAEKACRSYWEMQSGFSTDFVHNPRCSPADAGATKDGGASNGGGSKATCGCTVPGRSAPASGTAVAAALALSVAVLRRRRPR